MVPYRRKGATVRGCWQIRYQLQHSHLNQLKASTPGFVQQLFSLTDVLQPNTAHCLFLSLSLSDGDRFGLCQSNQRRSERVVAVEGEETYKQKCRTPARS